MGHSEEDGILADGFSPSGAPTGLRGPATVPGSVGLATPMSTARRVSRVQEDWDVPNPPMRLTPEIRVRGATLADVARELDTLAEWGEGGGALRADRIPAGTTTDVEVQLRGNLVFRMPTWTGYSSGSPAVQAEWDRMIEKLDIHERRHVEIAIEEGDQLARDLIGENIRRVARMVTAANTRMAGRQRELDSNTLNGSKPGVQYGDVTLDVSIT